jgi:hypothetical protein
VKEKVKDQVDGAGGPGGMLKDAAKDALPFGGGGDDGDEGGKDGTPGAGQGRRMPVQQRVDIALPLETVYNQWTQFEEWPKFMHRVKRATQEDECTVSFAVKIWGITREFSADIETQRPDDRIKWKVSQGMTHTGVVSFRELAPSLTRVELGFDVDPGGLLEKFARGARHVKRASRGDFHRFKGFVEMAEQETGAWRGVIEEGELVEEHDPSYDQQREYADVDELTQSESEQDGEDEQEEGSEQPRGRSRASGSDSSKSGQSRGGGRRGGEQKASGSSGKQQRGRQSSGSGQSRSGGGSQKRRASGDSSSSGSSRGRSTSRSGGRSRSSASSSGRRSGGGRGSRSQGSKR